MKQKPKLNLKFRQQTPAEEAKMQIALDLLIAELVQKALTRSHNGNVERNNSGLVFTEQQDTQ